MVALACAIVRGDEWFLSGFWADPDLRQRGIGGPLLREVWDEGMRRGCRRQFVWASIDPTAIATYMKLGMLPGTQLFAFAGTPHVGPTPVDSVPLDMSEAAVIDAVTRGARRDVDHEWWLSDPRNVARLVTRGSRPLGYFYAAGGRIGPVAWLEAADADAVLGAAMSEAAPQAPVVRLVAPGVNHTALRLALRAGLRIERVSHLLWTRPIGDMERYVPSGPLLF